MKQFLLIATTLLTFAIAKPVADSTSANKVFTATGTWYRPFSFMSNPTTYCGTTLEEAENSRFPLVAVSENMFGPHIPGEINPMCGKCYVIQVVGAIDSDIRPQLNTIKVKVADVCTSQNKWCPETMDQVNQHGATVNFDFMYQSLGRQPQWKDAAFKNNLKLKSREIPCWKLNSL
ncbi:hypothetical protein MP638_003351 [Amoeboaphelidium occidentale]|nr:hypothetical protein MP638_003351 [Amoeboaphelidium occidentale]